MLGAAGRLGFAAAEAFRDAGWSVSGLVRPGRAAAVPQGVEPVEATTRDEAIAAGRGCDVVLNGFNPVITEWQKNAMSLAFAAIAVAEENHATLLFPGNIWNFGRDMPPVLDESTPTNPTSYKGRLRADMEQRIREACDRGMRAIVVRAGDYFGGGRGSWFDLVITKQIARGRLTYPGPLDVVHAWAYLPDLVQTIVRLAERSQSFGTHEIFGFPGHSMTGRELIGAIETAAHRKFEVKRLGWWLIKTFGRLHPVGRELAEIDYLWRIPHRISGEKLNAALGEVPHTPLPKAIGAALKALDPG